MHDNSQTPSKEEYPPSRGSSYVTSGACHVKDARHTRCTANHPNFLQWYILKVTCTRSITWIESTLEDQYHQNVENLVCFDIFHIGGFINHDNSTQSPRGNHKLV
jgi:hypothetical protein